MDRQKTLRESFEKRTRSRPMAHAIEINDDGLVLGAGAILAHMTRDAFGSPVLALDADFERLQALLAAAHGLPTPPDLERHLEDACAYWRRGDRALANIRLALAQIPRLEERADAYRLFLAEGLLDDGLPPRDLMKALGFEPPRRRLEKYDPRQPRVPAGSGRTSGRWTSGEPGAAATTPAPTPPASTLLPPALGFVTASGPRTLYEALFGAGPAARGFLAALGRFAARLDGPALVLGAIFIPSPNRVVSEGAVAGAPDLSYAWNRDEGSLRLYRDDGAGRRIVAAARLGRGGIFYQYGTDWPIGRVVDGSLVFDADSLPDAEGRVRAGADSDEPRLCPDPKPDTPHGASDRAWAYQEQISRLNNPQRPLLRPMGVQLTDPATGEIVYFDDCRESDGTMIEAKGLGYAWRLHATPEIQKGLEKELADQAKLQVDAAGSRDIEWYFAEQEVADTARKLFEGFEELKKIRTYYVPAEQK